MAWFMSMAASAIDKANTAHQSMVHSWKAGILSGSRKIRSEYLKGFPMTDIPESSTPRDSKWWSQSSSTRRLAAPNVR